jgi:hypothetical protein
MRERIDRPHSRVRDVMGQGRKEREPWKSDDAEVSLRRFQPFSRTLRLRAKTLAVRAV